MFNKFKNIRIKKREGLIASTAMVVSILAIFISLGSQTTECALADDTCTVSSTETFTGDVGIMSATNNTFLIQHALTNDVTANVQDSGGTHLGTLILNERGSEDLRHKLIKNGCSASFHYPYLHLSQYYNSNIPLGNLEDLDDRIINLPIHQNLSAIDVSKIVEVICK